LATCRPANSNHILFQGRLLCQGTVSQLKSEFRCGYQLTVQKKRAVTFGNSAEAAGADLETEIRTIFPECEKLDRSGPLETSETKSDEVRVCGEFLQLEFVPRGEIGSWGLTVCSSFAPTQ
jgi:hypothetical protein